MVAQRHGTQRNPLDRAFGGGPAFDVFADAEHVLGEEEDPGEHVAHKRLRPEAHREAHHAGAGQQRRDLDAARPQRRQDKGHGEQHRGGGAQQRQQGQQARIGIGFAVRVVRPDALQAVVDGGADHDPHQVREQRQRRDAEQGQAQPD